MTVCSGSPRGTRANTSAGRSACSLTHAPPLCCRQEKIKIDVKGKGVMSCFWVLETSDERCAPDRETL